MHDFWFLTSKITIFVISADFKANFENVILDVRTHLIIWLRTQQTNKSEKDEYYFIFKIYQIFARSNPQVSRMSYSLHQKYINMIFHAAVRSSDPIVCQNSFATNSMPEKYNCITNFQFIFRSVYFLFNSLHTVHKMCERGLIFYYVIF